VRREKPHCDGTDRGNVTVAGLIPKQTDALRDYLKAQYKQIQLRQQQGTEGGQIVASLTGLADGIIEQLHRQVIESSPSHLRWKLEDGLAIVALGGYGRGELAPYSDIDLMFLHRDSIKRNVQEPSARILKTLWDIGYRVGHSLRTIDDCVALGRKDLSVRTALMEARFLAGNQRLFDQFRTRFHRKVVLKRPASYVRARILDRQKEYEQYGTTVYLLEPHVKMSQGGLRDLHLLRWAAMGQYHTTSLETLKHHGILSARDYGTLVRAQEFLWRVRNELHFAANRCQDRLTFEEQIRLAGQRGFQDDTHLLAVEQFMKQYYEQTTAVFDISHRLVDQMAGRTMRERLKKILRRRYVEGYFHIAGDEISISSEARFKVLNSTAELLKLFHLAQIHGVRLSYGTQLQIKKAREDVPLTNRIDSESASFFLKILNKAGYVTKILREMHRLKWLEMVIPEFSQARGLMQFNEYHKYTVDEHCLRAVEEAEALLHQPGNTARVYLDISRKDILHLALLVHDLGKGQGTDHSMIGIQIAENLADRLQLDSETKRVLTFLVGQHLLMTRIAFRRDLSDQKVLLQFAKTVATPEVLRMLYVLTLADVAAVGPGTLTAWKKDLLSELFTNVLEILTGEMGVMAEAEKIENVKRWILSHVEPSEEAWTREQLSVMTTRYLLSTPSHLILQHMKRIKQLPTEQVLVDASYDTDRQTTKYTVYTMDDLTPGIFYKIAGVLASRGLQILGATIITWTNGTVVDTFQVQDPDFAGAPTARKLEKVGHAIQEVLRGQATVEALLNQSKRIQSHRTIFPRAIPTQVEVDNGSSDPFTIVEVFAEDRLGLLFIMARAMFDLGLSVHTAKVSTQLDQIVDVFYVTDKTGRKIKSPEDIQKLRQKLTDEIEHFHEEARRSSVLIQQDQKDRD
jgi:[protein-PII] uridylyltransferase